MDLPERDKIDPRLAQAMQAIEASDEPSRTVPVLIEPARRTAPAEGTSKSGLRDLGSRVAESQESIVRALDELGVAKDTLTTTTLSSTISTLLTPDQVQQLARRADVRFLRLNFEEHVAT